MVEKGERRRAAVEVAQRDRRQSRYHGRTLFIVAVIIPCRFVAESLVDIELNGCIWFLIIEIERAGGLQRIEEQCVPADKRRRIAHRCRHTLDRLPHYVEICEMLITAVERHRTLCHWRSRDGTGGIYRHARAARSKTYERLRIS